MKLNYRKKFKSVVCAIIAVVTVGLAFTPPAQAQVTPTTWGNCLSNANFKITDMTATNLTASQYNRIPVRQGKGLVIAPQYTGLGSTNTGTVGLLFTGYYKTNSMTTTTWPFAGTSTANGTTTVRDAFKFTASQLDGFDSIALTRITNNVLTGVGVVTFSNVVFQYSN